MSGIGSSIQLNDQMTPVLRSITDAMNIMLNSFSAAQSAAETGIDTAAMNAARESVVNATAAVEEYQEQIKKAAQEQSKLPAAPQQPVWNALSGNDAFMGTGAERFQMEMQSANQAAQELFQSQQAISARARQMQVIPPGMLNDVAMVENKVQELAARVGELDKIPMDLRTDKVNNEIERIRGQLFQATQAQEMLNDAVSQMDVNAANTAYQRLNAIIDSTDRDIRDNLAAQEQFNRSLREGQGAASGLEGKVKSIALSAAAAFSAQKVIQLADSATQTTARLNLMNDGLQTTEELNQMIFASAQRARAPYMDTAGAIAKMGLNAGNAFESNAELIAFMEQVNKQFAIGGATAQEQSNAMVQLSQAMAAGALRGEELNSILDAAPGIARTIEKSMGWAEGSIKQYAEKGAVSAQVVKNSLLNMAEETNAQFNSIPMTFSQMITTVQTTLLQTFWPVIQMIGSGASLINENWSMVEPVLYGAAAGILAAAAAWGIYTAYQWIANGAAQTFLTTLLKNPLFWIALVIGVIVAVIYRWVQSVGGLRVAWLICVNAVLTQAERMRLGFLAAGMGIQNAANDMQYGFAAFKAGTLNHLGQLKVQGLTILQDFINGAIDRINKLISYANKIPGVSIEVLGHVEFAAGAAVEEEQKRQQRASALEDLQKQNAASRASRQQAYDRQQRAADDARMQRQADIAAARNDAAKRAEEQELSFSGAGGEIAGNTGKTAGNTAAMADSMEMAEEELKSIRDMAEQEVINRFTTAELTVNMGGITNQVNSTMDLDGIGQYMEDTIFEVLETAAEGDY